MTTEELKSAINELLEGTIDNKTLETIHDLLLLKVRGQRFKPTQKQKQELDRRVKENKG